MLYETWLSREALDAHLAQPYLVDFLNGADEVLANDMDIRFYDEIVI